MHLEKIGSMKMQMTSNKKTIRYNLSTKWLYIPGFCLLTLKMRMLWYLISKAPSSFGTMQNVNNQKMSHMVMVRWFEWKCPPYMVKHLSTWSSIACAVWKDYRKWSLARRSISLGIGFELFKVTHGWPLTCSLCFMLEVKFLGWGTTRLLLGSNYYR